MQKVEVQLGDRSYPICINSHFNDLLAEYKLCKQVVIVSNPVVAELYLPPIKHLFSKSRLEIILIPDGEVYKTLESFELIQSFLLQHQFSRDVLLVALGGGVIGDLTGFVAATYQRGVRFLQIPTTLLAQVDSSVGGKTAVNHVLGKNMIGAFKQPVQVLINTQALVTLPSKEFAAGMAEVIKYAVIADKDFFSWLLAQQQAILALDNSVLGQMIKHCCQMKADIVSRDETEQGDRALLNLGHTFGHAIEAHLGYGSWLHGEAVAVGMVMAAKLSLARGWLAQQDIDQLTALLIAFSLPTSVPKDMHITDFLPYMKMDKKVINGKMRFVLPMTIGSCALIDDVTEDELLQVFADGLH
ncbi:3-dehydroquinate synthase [Rheinheimera sp. MMS21-TC3]|uniref:3-dehydroquinate synthase n=1 Tax=Rheinheimera sp. MMS21-TC3 TaxID=3072790 RepID=UPI0028C38695|nr:3-dehydroquinate synthase [Rheinheimera sp. MMS21-TC3]WNO60492.1 3-dehydroquinate synthase [Rheinheimera sp. MMS21-TC3]